MLEFLKTLDRRWIFLLMFLAVAIPILGEVRFPEKPSGLAKSTFEEIEKLQPGSKVLLSFDFDPASEGELGPMATAFVRHCAEKQLKMYFMALWPVGPQMIDDAISKVIFTKFPHLVYGDDYLSLGFKAGNEGVIKVIVTNLRQMYTTDDKGTPLDAIPMMQGIRSVRDFDLVINVSAGYAGTKEWVQYGVTAFPKDIRMVAGCTGVQAPLLYPYIPEQLPGLLGAIKGAAEYEALVMDKYGEKDAKGEFAASEKPFLEGIRRMGPQLVAHLLMIALIIVGNVIYFLERKQGNN
jgi:hypothetical protein